MMAQYEYNGCVTGFSENGVATLWQPTRIPFPVNPNDSEYSQRLLDLSLLMFTGPITFKFDGKTKLNGTAKFA